jgi:DNA-binding SARP family transcriptional activator
MTVHIHELVRGRDSTHAPAQHPARARAHRAKASLRVCLLDGLSLHVDGREVALSSRKAKALIGYLVLAPGMRETRDRLVGLLWSETPNAAARGSLRQLLHLIRRAFNALGVQALAANKFHVSLDEMAVTTDLDDAFESVDRGHPADCLLDAAHITDSLLRGHDDLDRSFASWLRIKRESVRQLLIHKLEARLCDTEQPEATKRIARALSQLDPTHEVACQKMMRACIACGNTAAAMAAYKRLWQCLEEEYDIEPSTATQELVVAIKRGTCLPPVLGPARGAPAAGGAVDATVPA